MRNHWEFLAQKFPEFQPEGVKILLDELKKTKNWFMYAACCETFGIPPDSKWYNTHKQKTKLHVTQTEAKINKTRRARGNIQVQSISSIFLGYRSIGPDPFLINFYTNAHNK